MKEYDKARPVSGEIMAGGRSPRAAAQPVDFSDADYVTVDPAVNAPRAPVVPPPSGGMDFLRRGTARSDDNGRGGPLFWATGLAMVALAFWISGGHAFVRQSLPVPAAESTQPLRIAKVKSRVETHNGRDVLFVDGHAENHGTVTLVLPAIEIAVIGNDGGTARYFLGTNGSELKPGDRYSFSSRLEPPRNGVKTVAVTFREGSL